jgi:hypothetical protein
MYCNIVIFFIILFLITQFTKKNHIFLLTLIWVLLCFVKTKNRENFISSKYCIVIPSFPPHFKYVNKLLKSINDLNTDEETITIYLTMNKDDYDLFDKVNYNKINLVILFLEDLYEEQLNVEINSRELLEHVEKYTFQSMKKLLSIHHGFKSFDYVYVLDSEGVFIKPFSMNKHINSFLTNKRIFYNSKQRKDGNQWTESSKILLKSNDIPGWLLENYFWVYEKDIFKNIYNIITKNIETKEQLYNMKKDIFIEVFYNHYIYLNNKKYNYKFIDSYENIKNDMNQNELNSILTKPYTLLEDTRWNLNENTYSAYVKFFKKYNITNYKIEINEINLRFIKDNPQIILINSGDFPLEFNLKI